MMKVDFMRKLDYWAGNPICYFLSWIYRIKLLFTFSRSGAAKSITPKKILFLELSEMGSTVLAYPAMAKAKELYPDAELHFMIFRKNAESVKILGIIPEKNIITIKSSSLFVFAFSFLKAVIECRARKIDTVIDMELFSRVTAILTYLIGAKNRVGFYRYTMEGLYRGGMQTHKVSYNPHHHIGINFLSLVYSLQSSSGEIPLTKRKITKDELRIPKIRSSKTEMDHIWKKMKAANKSLSKDNRLVVVNPNAGLLPIRAWPIRNYAELCKRLVQDPDILIVITGIGEAEKDAEMIIRAAGQDKCINLVNKTSFRELIGIYNTCHLLITNDSGPVHFAPLTQIKVIAFFGPETHRLYGPLGDNVKIISSELACSPCVSAFNHRKTVCRDNQCLKCISVDYVYNIVREAISDGSLSLQPILTANTGSRC